MLRLLEHLRTEMGMHNVQCTSSSVSAGSYDSSWKVSSKSSSRNKNTATAKATAKKYYGTSILKTTTVTTKLTCSPTGKFS